MNRRSALRLRINQELPIDEFQPLPHTGKTKPLPGDGHFGIKADASIMHTQVDLLIQYTLERHFELAHTTMLYSIPEGFLQDAEEAE